MTIEREYFDWLCRLVCGDGFSKQVSYEKLLMYLHDVPFTYSFDMDENRAKDGVELRYRFAHSITPQSHIKDILYQLRGSCSVFEMMVALAVRCEEWMDNTKYGDRTGQWFWEMVVSLGLGGMTNDRFDLDIVEPAIARFLDRNYEPNGRGGLFTIMNCHEDLRDVQIWYQMCWYLNSVS